MGAYTGGGPAYAPPGGDVQMYWSPRTSSQEPMMRGFQSENWTAVTLSAGVAIDARSVSHVSPQPILRSAQGAGAQISLVVTQSHSPVSTVRSPVVTL